MAPQQPTSVTQQWVIDNLPKHFQVGTDAGGDYEVAAAPRCWAKRVTGLQDGDFLLSVIATVRGTLPGSSGTVAAALLADNQGAPGNIIATGVGADLALGGGIRHLQVPLVWRYYGSVYGYSGTFWIAFSVDNGGVLELQVNPLNPAMPTDYVADGIVRDGVRGGWTQVPNSYAITAQGLRGFRSA